MASLVSIVRRALTRVVCILGELDENLSHSGLAARLPPMAQPVPEPIHTLKKHKHDLSRVRVFIDGGGEKCLAVPDVRTRWAKLMASLDQLDWVKLEGENVDGETLAIIDNPNATEELEEFEPAGDLEDLGTEQMDLGKHHEMAQLVRAQDLVLRHHTAMARMTFEAQNRVIEILSEQLGTQNENYMEALAGMNQYAVIAAEAEAAGKPEADDAEGLMADPLMKKLIGSAVEGGAKAMVEKMTGGSKE